MKLLAMLLIPLPFTVSVDCEMVDENHGDTFCEKKNLKPRVHQENDFRAPDFDLSQLKVAELLSLKSHLILLIKGFVFGGGGSARLST